MTALGLFNSVNLSGDAISVVASVSFWFVVFLIIQAVILQFREISYRIVGNRKTTSDLHQEFNNESMTKNRNKAHGYIKINFDRTIDSILDEYTKSRDDDKIMSLITIMRFYQRMNALIKDGAIRRETTFNLFAETYIWWYECYLHKGFESWETAHCDLIELHSWFYNYSHRKLPPLRWRTLFHPIRSFADQKNKRLKWEKWTSDAKRDLAAWNNIKYSSYNI